MTDYQGKNFRITMEDKLVCIDLGHSFVPYSQNLFYKMCMRAYLTMIIADNPRIKEFITYTNNNDDFNILREIGLNSDEHKLIFDKFYSKVNTFSKNEYLNPSIFKVIESQDNINSCS